MKKDLPENIVADVAVALVPEAYPLLNDWYVYLLNMKEEQLETVLVSSKGYDDDGTERTTILRKNLGNVDPQTAVKIEPMTEELFMLNNRFWVSFWNDGVMYDKKFVIRTGLIREEQLTELPLLDKKGMIIS